MKRVHALRAALAALRAPSGSMTIAQTLAQSRELRAMAEDLTNEMIELLDQIDGDPDFEFEHEIGIEDLPHDQLEEGNDEPWLSVSGEPALMAQGALLDGEEDLVEEADLPTSNRA